MFHPSLKQLVYESPYRFYDHLIKSAARLFITEDQEFKDPHSGKCIKKKLTEFRDVCELIFITATRDRLIMSRGTDGFDPKKKIRVSLNWH
jgi:hypothetical protein